jgi:hypothetical protein
VGPLLAGLVEPSGRTIPTSLFRATTS